MWLGVRVCERKLVVQEVVADTPAATAGIEPGERIISVNGESNVNDIHDDLNEVGPANPLLVVVRHGNATRELPIVPAVRPNTDLKRDDVIYVPETAAVEVEAGSPYTDIDCRDHCIGSIPNCDPLFFQSQGTNRLYVKWHDKLVRYDSDFWGRIFRDRTLCLKEVQERCAYVL